MINYDIELQPHNKLFRIRLSVECAQDEITLKFPKWIPGSYLIRDFAKHIQNFKTNAQVTRPDNHTWILQGKQGGQFVVEYDVYAYDFSVRGAYITLDYAFFNGPSLFFEVQNLKSDYLVKLNQPKEAIDWHVATTMPQVSGKVGAFATYTANDYQELIDHPVLMGKFERHQFDVAGILHEIALVGKHCADIHKLVGDAQKICLTHQNMFGESPFKNYLFILIVAENAYGGLEHKTCSMNMCSRKDLPVTNMKNRKNYVGLLGLLSHEYFHAWNVKRIKPVEFMPYDLSQAVPTNLLWAFEGITSYYDDLALMRSGVITQQEYLTKLAETITLVTRNKGRNKQTIIESSFDAWTKFYQPNENSINAVVSYYTKGALIALCCDLLLHSLGNDCSLDKIMRTLWQKHGKVNQGVEDNTIQNYLIDLGGDKLGQFLDLALNSTKAIPLQECLALAGLDLTFADTFDYQQLGGAEVPKLDMLPVVSLGVNYSACKVGVKITQIWQDSNAAKAGLWANDQIIAIDNFHVTVDKMIDLMAQYQPNQSVNVHFFRHGILHQTQVQLVAPKKETAFVSFAQSANPSQKSIQAKWLHSKT